MDDWLALLRSRYTTYVVIVRDVDLAREKGASEQLKVGSVIKRDLLAAAALRESSWAGRQRGRPPLEPAFRPGRNARVRSCRSRKVTPVHPI